MSLTKAAADTYRVDSWGLGYFLINRLGQACVNLPTSYGKAPIPLTDIINEAENRGLNTPVLIRFPDILADRVKTQTMAFNQARENHQYQGGYQPIYPIKVNQEKHVVEALVNNAEETIGLEAGSKAELLAILAVCKKSTKIILNGYKDSAFLEVAFIAQSLGHDVTIVIEKPWEVDLILQLQSPYPETPQLGIRVRLASIGKGQWQNTGGEKSKFGLSSQELLSCLQDLRKTDLIAKLKLLHVHLGSQIANLADLETGLTEATQVYAALFKQDVMLDTLDVGGGLAIDYTGGHSIEGYSAAYDLTSYADRVIACVKRVCQSHKLPHPNIVTESGRGLTAHHAVLVTSILGVESRNGHCSHQSTAELEALAHCETQLAQLSRAESGQLESFFSEASSAVQAINGAFLTGKLGLETRAAAENLYNHILKQLLGLCDQRHGDFRRQLETLCSQKLICNFSVFSSTPDVWGIEQVFPILPIEKLNQPLDKAAVIHDITCDSDGRIDDYAVRGNISNSLPIPALTPGDKMAVFLVGAYQEVLGDIHNLFGDTHSVAVEAKNGQWSISDRVDGENVTDLLHYLHFSEEETLAHLGQYLSEHSYSEDEKNTLLKKLGGYLQGYTYPKASRV